MKQLIVLALIASVSSLAAWGMTPKATGGPSMADIKTVDFVKFAAVPDKQGRVWFIEKVEFPSEYK